MTPALCPQTGPRRPPGRPSMRPAARAATDGQLVLRNLCLALLIEGRMPRRRLSAAEVARLTGMPARTVRDARDAGLAMIDFLDSAGPGDDAAA